MSIYEQRIENFNHSLLQEIPTPSKMRVGDYIACAFHIHDLGANIPAVIINRIAKVEGNKITYHKSEEFTTTCRRKKMDGEWVCHQSSGFYIRCQKYLTQENLESFLSQQGQE